MYLTTELKLGLESGLTRRILLVIMGNVGSKKRTEIQKGRHKKLNASIN